MQDRLGLESSLIWKDEIKDDFIDDRVHHVRIKRKNSRVGVSAFRSATAPWRE
jgi:hypothetical protein